MRLYDLMLRCLAPHVGGRLPAGNFASICGTVIGGPHPDTGRHFTIVEPQLGGWGGSRPRRQQRDVLRLPRRHVQLPRRGGRGALRPVRRPAGPERQPGGEGEHRGGKGIVVEYRVRADGCFFTCAYTRNKHGRGRRPEASKARRTTRRSRGSTEPSSKFAVVTALSVNEGDVIRIHTGNGGGFGDPRRRPRELVLDDLRNGYTNVERARAIYGDVLDG